MLQSNLGWTNLEHYLDNFIHVMAADLAIPEQLQHENTAYQFFTDCLGILCQNTKDVEGTIVLVFGLEVNTNKCIICVPPDKVAQAQQATSLAFKQPSLILKEAQSLTGFFSFCAQAVCLESIFMCYLWNFIAKYLFASSQFTRRCLPAKVYKNFT